MIRMSKALLAVGITVAALMGAPRAAHADPFGYACSVFESWNTRTDHGNYGYVDLSLFSGPNCTGDNLGVAWFDTTGSLNCPAATLIRSEARLNSISHKLTTAVADGLKVGVNVTTGPGGLQCATGFWITK
jgi:hypothetical protein